MSSQNEDQEKKRIGWDDEKKASLPAVISAEELRPDLSPKKGLIREIRVGWEKKRSIKIYAEGESMVEKIETTYRLVVAPASWKIARFVGAIAIAGSGFAIFLKVW